MGLNLTGLGSAFDFAGGLLDRFFPKQVTEADRAAMQAKLSQAKGTAAKLIFMITGNKGTL